MLTVKALVDDLELSLLAGEQGADAPLRWVHITELLDPTPWLSGGELLLTTGLQLQTAAKQRQFVRRLSTHHLAGLGFGTGFEHQQIPSAVLAEARRLEFPIFEVPYEMPFIAITEKAFGRLVNDQYETLQRGISFHKRLEQLVLEERGSRKSRAPWPPPSAARSRCSTAAATPWRSASSAASSRRTCSARSATRSSIAARPESR